MLEGMPLQ